MSVCIAFCKSVRNGQKKMHKPCARPFNAASATTMFSRLGDAEAGRCGKARSTKILATATTATVKAHPMLIQSGAARAKKRTTTVTKVTPKATFSACLDRYPSNSSTTEGDN
jgi:hypothetical protein